MKKNELCIDVLGTAVTIFTDEDPVYLRTLLEKYRNTIENVKRNSGLTDPLKLAVLTGFLLSHDLEKAGTPESTEGIEKNEDSGEAERLTLGMITRLDEVLDGQNWLQVAAPEPEYPETGPAVPASAGPADFIISERAIYKLKNQVKNYDWGSPEWIPALLGLENPGKSPWAELGMGINPGAPSRIVGESGEPGPLLSEITRLPFLYKLLAAAKPLSIQVHPNPDQAREGFERENQEDIPLDDPKRSYLDFNHKPEIISALSPFAALCGFRKVLDIHTLITKLYMSLGNDEILKNTFETLLFSLKGENENPYGEFLSALFGLETAAKNALSHFLKSHSVLLERKYPENRNEWKICAFFAGLYPGDPGVMAPLYLNIIELAPGQAIYFPPGILHTYIHGLGLELTADSSNVLRGGITSKYINPDELLKIAVLSEYKPEILENPEPDAPYFEYPSPEGEFSLSVMQNSGGENPGGTNVAPGAALPYPEKNGPSIIFISAGNALVKDPEDNSELHIKTGESFFVPPGKKLEISGTFTAYAAAAK